MKRWFWRLGAAFFLASALPGFAQDILIESRKEGKNFEFFKELEGEWIDSQTTGSSKSSAPGLTDEKLCGSRKVMIPADKPEPIKRAVARFAPTIPGSKYYFVYTTWSRAANATPVIYKIKHANGIDERAITQNGWGVLRANKIEMDNANRWVSLGGYMFSTKDEQYVEMVVEPTVKRADPNHQGQAFADAVLFSLNPVPDAVEASATSQPPEKAATASAPAPIAVTTPVAPPDSSTPASGFPAQLRWHASIAEAQEAAAKSGRKILIFFYAPAAKNSQYYDNEVFNDARVKAHLAANFEMVRLNFAENQKLATDLGVFRASTLVLYNSNGDFLSVIKERLTIDEILEKLK